MQIFKPVVTTTQFARPVGILEGLVYKQRTPALSNEPTGKLNQRMFCEEKVIKVNVEARTRTFMTAPLRLTLLPLRSIGCLYFFGTRQKEIGLTYSTAAFNRYQSVRPVDFVHQLTADRRIRVRN